MAEPKDISRDHLAELLNEDLAREYQAIIAYTVYSNALKGAQWMNIVGAVGFIINSGWNGAWPSAWLNIVWLAIGIYGVTRSRRIA